MGHIYSGINIYIYIYIYISHMLHGAGILTYLFGHMLGFISNTWSIWVLEMLIVVYCNVCMSWDLII